MCAARTSGSPAIPLMEKLALTVDNSGNFFFQEALRRQIEHDKVIHSFDDPLDDIHTLALCLANFIRPTEDFGGQAEILEKSRIERVIMTGGGAQAYDYEKDLAIPKGTMRFLKVLSERSKFIGVRGYYTAELLDRNGIRNVEVTGCPSIFWHMNPGFSMPRFKEKPDGARLAIHATPSGYYRDVIAKLFAFAIRHQAEYILQNEHHIVPAIDPQHAPSGEALEKFRFFASYYKLGHITEAEMQEWLRNKSHIFFSIEEWVRHLKSRSLVFGARFHGNVAALLAGVRNLTMVFDTRTREMCEYANLPYILLQDFHENTTLEELSDIADFSAFNAGYENKYHRYVQFLENNGLRHNLKVNPHFLVSGIHAPAWAFQENLIRSFAFEDRVKLKSLADFMQSTNHEAGVERFLPSINRLRDMREEQIRHQAEASATARVELPEQTIMQRQARLPA
jgi:hypothetical protein